METAPRISVIVPVYNVEAYLARCLTSIVNQTYRNIEIILVNDGSTDGSLAIAERFADSDARIRIYSQRNAGQSAARNYGLSVATGRYVVFIDSDDWIETDALSESCRNIGAYNADFASFRFSFDRESAGLRHVYGTDFPEKLEGPAILSDAIIPRHVYVAPWNKIYDRAFLQRHDLRFRCGIVNEDTLFALQAAACARRVSFVNEVLYHAVERADSTSRSSYGRLFRDMHTALSEAAEYLKDKGRFREIEPLFYARYVKSMLYNLLQAAQRLPYAAYRKDYGVCVNETLYRQYNTAANRRRLSFRHRGMALVSRSPRLLFAAVRLLNRFGFRMH